MFALSVIYYRGFHLELLCCQVKRNSERQRKLELDIAELKSHCEALKDSIDSNIGDYECQLLETLDRIKVVRQAYHGNVFIGNHCKIILKNYEKLYDVVSDEPEFHGHISESFCIYSELDKLISAKRFLTEIEIYTVKIFCTGLEILQNTFQLKIFFEKYMN